ncbi:MAG: hypothetical protein HYV13_00525 [Candidatus Doudnabacteria bacterium]|nr:hypothetical protein [Candidatus Doudnabacteria bacterium]
MHISTVIEQLGYPPSEVRLYLAALDIGESTITDLANKVGMPRTSVQSVIEDMQNRGLMHSYIKRKRRYWVAENPEKLMILLKEREAALKSIMPELQAKRFTHGGRFVVQIYNGPTQIKLIMDDIIDTKHHISAIVSWDEWKTFLGSDFVKDFIERRVQHFLRVRLLTAQTPSSVELKKLDEQSLRHTKFLPDNAGINNSIFIYGNKLAIISINKRQPMGIVIDDLDIAHSAEILFEALWNQCLEH